IHLIPVFWNHENDSKGTADTSRSDSLFRRSRQLPELHGQASLARRCCVSYLRTQRCDVSQESTQVAMQEPSRATPVLRENAHDLRGLATGLGQMAYCGLDDYDSEERSFVLRDSPRYRSYAKDRVVHDASHSQSNADWQLPKKTRRARGSR